MALWSCILLLGYSTHIRPELQMSKRFVIYHLILSKLKYKEEINFWAHGTYFNNIQSRGSDDFADFKLNILPLLYLENKYVTTNLKNKCGRLGEL